MSKSLGIVSILLVISFLWAGAFFYAHAHEGEEHSSSYNLEAIHITQDESVDPGTLGVGAVNVLPGNPLYVFKNLSRGFRSTFTFSSEKKAELKLQFANEKIIEAQLLLDRGDKDRAADHLKSYEKDLARAKGIADKEKFIVQSIKHQAVIDKIEKEMGEEKAADIKEIREKTVEHVAEAVASIENVEAAKNALILATSDEGSAFKPLRNLEVLKAVEEKLPEQAKEAVRGAQENAVKRFKSDYDKGTLEEKAALTDYINENKGILGEELSGKLLPAGEEKKVTPPSATVPQKTISPQSSPKPSSTSQSAPKLDESVSKPLEIPMETPKITPVPAIEKKEEPKPYEGSPPLIY